MLHQITKKVDRLLGALLIIVSLWLPNLSSAQRFDTSKLIRAIEKELKRQGLPNAKFELSVKSQNQSGGQTAFEITNNYGAHSHVVNGVNNGINGDVNFLSEKYALMARLNIYGLEMESGYGFKIESGISLFMRKVATYDSGRYTLIQTEESEKCADSVIALYPAFPFAYWAKATLRLLQDDNSGIPYAKKGIEILEHTTQIEGHNPNHDEVLKILRTYVALNSTKKKKQ